jgi:hypothetical protein
MHKSVQSTQKLRGHTAVMIDAASTYSDVVQTFLKRKFAPLRNAAKLLAGAAGVSHRTSEHWLAGRHPPKAEELIRLMASCDELADEIFQLIQRQKCSDRSSSNSAERAGDETKGHQYP